MLQLVNLLYGDDGVWTYVVLQKMATTKTWGLHYKGFMSDGNSHKANLDNGVSVETQPQLPTTRTHFLISPSKFATTL